MYIPVSLLKSEVGRVKRRRHRRFHCELSTRDKDSTETGVQTKDNEYNKVKDLEDMINDMNNPVGCCDVCISYANTINFDNIFVSNQFKPLSCRRLQDS